MGAITLANLFHTVTKFLVGTRNMGNAAIAIGTTKSKIKTAAAIDYSIGGVAYTKAATDDLFVFTDVTVQPVGTTRYYLLGLDKDGASVVTTGTATELPDVPAGSCPVGYVKIVTDATHTFTQATTLLDAAGVTATYVNIAVPPGALA